GFGAIPLKRRLPALGRAPNGNTVSLQRFCGLDAPITSHPHRGAELIARYTREAMGRVWSDANKLARWLDVELAATETLAEAGQVPKESAAVIRARAKVDVARILE